MSEEWLVMVFGVSDDLIEVEYDRWPPRGWWCLREEFNAYEGATLRFGDGTVLRGKYGHDGVWHFERLTPGSGRLTICYPTAQEIEDDEVYTEKVTLTGTGPLSVEQVQ